MDRYTHNPFGSTRHDDLLREAATERLSRDSSPSSAQRLFRALATWLPARLSVAIGHGRDVRTANDTLKAAISTR